MHYRSLLSALLDALSRRYALHRMGGRVRSQYARLSTCLLLVCCAGALAGCAQPGHQVPEARAAAAAGPGSGATGPRPRTRIPLPAADLLKPQSDPKCDAPEPRDELRKLGWERECFRVAEIIVRYRLDQLQASVAKTIRAVKRSDRHAL